MLVGWASIRDSNESLRSTHPVNRITYEQSKLWAPDHRYFKPALNFKH